MTAFHLTIRVVHVVLGAFWTGSAILLALFIEPAVREAGPAGGTVMQALMRRGMSRILTWVGVFTVITGLYLIWVRSGHFASAWMGSLSGVLLSAGALLGITALLIGVHLTRPTIDALAKLGGEVAASGSPPSAEALAEMDRLRGRLRLFLRLVALTLVVTVMCMALGPHVS